MPWRTRSKRAVELSEKLERIHLVLSEVQQEIGSTGQPSTWQIQTILSYLQLHLFDPALNAEEVRRACNLRTNNISSRFRCVVGMGLKEFIETGRIEAAKRLLMEPDIEIYLIAVSIGYDHQETFFRAFNRRTGSTPSAWRSSACLEDRRMGFR